MLIPDHAECPQSAMVVARRSGVFTGQGSEDWGSTRVLPSANFRIRVARRVRSNPRAVMPVFNRENT
jgi:hypothetical protein